MRRPWFTLLITVLVTAIALGQPSNDDCENAIFIPLGQVGPCPSSESAEAMLSGDNQNATPSTPVFQLVDGFGAGPALNTSSADVWYSLQPSGNRLSASLESGLNQPVLILLEGERCGGPLPIAWARGTDGTGTVNLESAVEPGKRYFLVVGGTTMSDQSAFTLTASIFNDCSVCAQRRGLLTADPLPINGLYQAGQKVEFCYQASFWAPGPSLEWLHGVEVQFGSGWDLSTLETFAPDACTAPSGQWAWHDSWQSCNTGATFGPGFAFDSEYGLLCPGATRLDGDPGNNFGDGPCGSTNAGPLSLEFCWSVQAGSNFTSPEEANLNLEISLLGDGYSGSWMTFSCDATPTTTFYATAIPEAGLLPDINVVQAPCATGCDGIATVTGTTAGLWAYQLSGPGDSIVYSVLAQPGTDTIFGLCAGPHIFEVSNLTGTVRQSALLEIEAGPTPEAQAGFLPACLPGEPIQLVAGVNSNSGNITYQWTGPGGFSSSQPNPTTNEPGEYFLDVTVDGCSAPAASIEAESSVPEISCEAFPNHIVFSWIGTPGDTAYAVEVLTGQMGNWLTPTSFEVSGLAPGESASIALTVSDTGPCGTAVGEASCQALACPLPIVTPDTTLCQGQSVRLWANVPPNTTAVWSPADGLSCTNCIAPLASPSTSTNYQVSITYPDGCTANREVSVYISSLPESILPNATMPYCLGEPWEICLPEGNEYLWISPVGFITTGNCIRFPVTTELLTGTHTVLVRLPDGCEFYDYLYLYGKDCDDDTPPNGGFPTTRRGYGPNGTVSVFPNPAQNRLNVEMGFSGPKVLQLFRADGHRLLHQKTEANFLELSMASFPAGAYWLNVSGEGGRERMRIMIVR